MKKTSLVFGLLILLVVCSSAAFSASSEIVVIRGKYGCPGFEGAKGSYAKWCNAELSWDNGPKHPMASVEFDDRVVWELVPDKNSDSFIIRSKYGCPCFKGAGSSSAKWCNAELSWDNGPKHPMASVEFNDRVLWELDHDKDSDSFIIRSKYGCSGYEGARGSSAKWCNAELSWDNSKKHPMASVEFNDRVLWELLPATKDGNIIDQEYGRSSHKKNNRLQHEMSDVEQGIRGVGQVLDLLSR